MTKRKDNFDERFCLGVCWYPEQWPENLWPSDVARMREVGIRLVRLGEFAWSRLQPEPHLWHTDWLARALDLLHDHGLRAVIGTPSATPPRWLLDDWPDLVRVDDHGHADSFGSRRFACLAHAGYVRAGVLVARKLAQTFGQHPAVCGWQIDNEYGCHDTAFSYSTAATALFRRWLRRRYSDITALNDAWGNAFWSMEYGDFSHINAPLPTPAGHNPALLIDFRRFWTERITTVNRRQVNAIRRYSPGRDLLHDFMGFFTDFDHFVVASDLDVAAWNSYPLGFLARFGEKNTRSQYMRSGHPDYAAFHHDLYRACGQGRFWVTEQQPGPVNWAPYNPIPAPGMVRLWTLEAFAHGAEVVSYFRWRQAASGQEQMHAGLFLPNNAPTSAVAEVAQVAHDIAQLPAESFALPKADVALVFDYESIWMADIIPHGDRAPLAAVLDFYAALRRAGVDLDIVSSHADFAGYKLVVVPLLCAPPEDFASRLQAAGSIALFGPRTGAKTPHLAIPPELPPGNLRELLGLTVLQVDSLPPEMPMLVDWQNGEAEYEEPPMAVRWREMVHPHEAQTLAKFAEDGHSAVLRNHDYFYLACRPDRTLMDTVMAAVLRHAHVETLPPPPHVRVKRRGNLRWLFNYGKQPAKPHVSGEVIMGAAGDIPPGGVAALRIG